MLNPNPRFLNSLNLYHCTTWKFVFSSHVRRCRLWTGKDDTCSEGTGVYRRHFALYPTHTHRGEGLASWGGERATRAHFQVSWPASGSIWGSGFQRPFDTQVKSGPRKEQLVALYLQSAPSHQRPFLWCRPLVAPLCVCQNWFAPKPWWLPWEHKLSSLCQRGRVGLW